MAWTSPRTWVTGEVVTATHMNAHVRDNLAAVIPTDAVTSTSWTPNLEATVTNNYSGSTTGRQWRVGPIQYLWARFTSLTAGTPGDQLDGVFFVTLPVAAVGITANTTTGQVIGSIRGIDASNSANTFAGIAYLATSTTMRFAGSASSANSVTSTAPFTWVTADVFTISVSYPVA